MFKGIIKLKTREYICSTSNKKLNTKNNMSASKMVIFGKDFNPRTDMVIKEKKQNKNGNGYSAGIVNSKTSRSLFIQTPMMLTWGVNEIRDKDTQELQGYSLSLQFPRDEDDNNDDEMKAFFDSMVDFDKVVCEEAKKNSQKWCKKKTLSDDLLDAYYDSRVVRYSRFPDGHPQAGDVNSERKPTIRIKLPFYNKEFNTEIYNVDMKRLFPRNPQGKTPPEIIGKGDNVIAIMQCGGIWFAGTRFGVTWKLHQVILQKKENLRGRCFIQLSDKQRDAMASNANTEEEDTYDEADPEPASAPAPDAPAPAPDVEPEGEDEDNDNQSLSDVLSKGPKFNTGVKLKTDKESKDDEPDVDLEDMDDDLN